MAFLSGYNRRQKITIDSDTYISSDLSSQAIAIHIPNTNTEFWANDDGDGTYVRFTASDGTTLLDFEVESYDSGGEDAWWHVEVGTLLSASDTEIYIYYNATSPSDGSNREGTWDVNYMSVYHLSQDKPEGAFDDSTSGGFDLTNSGSTDRVVQIDKGRDLDGIDDVLYKDSIAGTGLDIANSNVYTLECWIDGDDLNSAEKWLQFGDPAGAANAEVWIQTNGTPNLNGFHRGNTGTAVSITGSTSLSTGTKYHAVFVRRAAGDFELYLNAVSEGTSATSPGTTDVDRLSLGARYDTGPAYIQFAEGGIDEVTISDTNRSLDWIKARYQSGLGTWLTFSAEETAGALNKNDTLLVDFINHKVIRVGRNKIDSWDTAGRPTGVEGIIGINTDLNAIDFYTGGSWHSAHEDHGNLSGLSDDDHTIYLLLAGRSGGQVAIGGTDAGDNLTLQSTAHATKGKILFGTSAYDEVNNNMGIGTDTPSQTNSTCKLHVSGDNIKLDANKTLVWDGTFPTQMKGASGTSGSILFNVGNVGGSNAITIKAGSSVNSLGVRVESPSEALQVKGNIYIQRDDDQLILGTGKDMTIFYDGTNGVIDLNDVAASDLNIDCGTDKTVELQETVWNDINFPGSALSQGVANKPDSISILSSGGIRAYGFDGNATLEELHGSGEILHDWKEGTALHPHVHWMPTTTNAGNVKWNIEYSWQNIDGTFSAPTTISVTAAAGGTAWVHKRSETTTISGSGLNINNAIVFRVYRDPTDVADTYPDDAAFIQVGFHYEIDTIGSRQELSK
jgi:hypothetical protein